MKTELTQDQITAIKCAYADLVGILQCYNECATSTHNWEAHLQSIKDLEEQFPFIEQVPVDLN